MKIKELQAIENEVINDLRIRATGGDNHASQVLLEHLRETSKRIEEWRKSQPEQKKGDGSEA